MFFENKQEDVLKGRLNLPLSIATELSGLVTLELKSETDEQLKPFFTPFMANINRFVTKGLLSGIVIFKPYIRGDQIRFSVVTPESFKILKWDEQQLIPTVTEFYEKRGDYLRVERHTLDGINYKVENSVLRNGKKVYSVPFFWGGYEDKVELTGISKPLFGVFSTYDRKPVYENAIPLIKEAEAQFERLIWEYKSGERALYVADTAFLKDMKGNPKVPDKRLYRMLSTSSDDLFKDFTPALRDVSIINGLDLILKRIEDSCAISRGTFSDVTNQARTATELKMSKHRTYAKVKELQDALYSAISDMLDASCALLCLYGERKNAKAELKMDFSDSVLDTAEVN